jgi:fatty acid-binding protein DegV
LKLNPLVELGAGKVRPLRPAFNRGAALERMIARLRRNRPDGEALLNVSAFHSLDPEPAVHLLKRITAETRVGESLICEFGPAMVSHAGPGVVGVAWWWEGVTE